MTCHIQKTNTAPPRSSASCCHTQFTCAIHLLYTMNLRQTTPSVVSTHKTTRNVCLPRHKQQQQQQQQPLRGDWLGPALVSLALLVSTPAASTPAAQAVVHTTEAGQNVGAVTDKDVDARRRKAGFRRAHDGHVAIQNKYTKGWTDVKLDLQVPGLLLLREADGQVYYLGYAGLKQVDLSDDLVVTAVAADTWEDNMTRVQAVGEDGGIEALELTREGFYELVSLVSDDDWGVGADDTAAAAAGAKQQQQQQQRPSGRRR